MRPSVSYARVNDDHVAFAVIGAREIEQHQDDIGGIGVHIAARVEACAANGEILVSRTVVDLVAGSGIQFRERGVQELKGVPGTWSLFALE